MAGVRIGRICEIIFKVNLHLILLRFADWNVPRDIVSTFNSADILGQGSNRVVFNTGGNKYRMICKYYFGKKKIHLFVKWIGTHSEYDKLCKENKQYHIDQY
jgi:mRNA interferase HigB